MKIIGKSLFFVAISCVVFTIECVEKKPWTFLVYMPAICNGYALAYADIREMMKVGSDENINILVYVTAQEPGQQKLTKKLYIEQDAMVHIGESVVRDSADITTLQEALQWACVDYPSDHMAVVLWDYPSAPLSKTGISMPSKTICYDADTAHYLTDKDLVAACTWVQDYLRSGKKIDIVACNTLFLASLEFAYALSSCVDYLVASESRLPHDGYCYALFLDRCKKSVLAPLPFAQAMVSAFKQFPIEIDDYAVSVIDLQKIDSIVNNCNAVAHILASQLKGKHKQVVKATIKKCINIHLCPSFGKDTHIDLCQFYRNLSKYSDGLQLSKSLVDNFNYLLRDGIQLISSAVKANVVADCYHKACGLSSYFARHSIDFSYYGLYWTEHNPNWVYFLEAFLS